MRCNTEVEKSIVTNHLSMEQARNRLQKILAQPTMGKTMSKSSHGAVCMNIRGGRAFDRNGNELTRAEEDSSYYYVFDIDNYGGYAIMGARFPLPEIVAICSGSDKVSNASLKDIEKNGLPVANLPNNLPVVEIDTNSKLATEDVQFIYDYDNITYTADIQPITNKWGKENRSIFYFHVKVQTMITI